MKTFATRKEIKSRFSTIIHTGAANLQNLLTLKSPDYYWSGEYGWYCDIYIINGIAICTGYQSFGNYNATSEVCEPFEKRATEILNEYTDYETQNKLLDNLIADFVGTVIGGTK